DQFPHTPTPDQDLALAQLAYFLTGDTANRLFLLRGYAGTGKTTLVGSLVASLWQLSMKYVLMAPTGRAAKVMARYSGNPSFTIHRKIYVPKKRKDGGVRFVLAPNKHRNTVFIVDEASMIPDTPSDSTVFENGSLLHDLFFYVYSGHGCTMVLIGDTAQLPPVGFNLSPALDARRLALDYDKDVISLELEEVLRQSRESGILANATAIREQLKGSFLESFQFSLSPYRDIIRLSDGYEIQEAIDASYSQNGREETACIVRSNKRANGYNANIRNRILFLENRIAPGDHMMVVKNNYFWLKPNSKAGFIANGDIIEVLEIFALRELYDFTFAEVKVRMVDYPGQSPFETVLLLDTITANTPSLPYEEGNRLYRAVAEDYADEKSNYKRFLAVKNNRFFNALQVKFSYAITCHKAQGGQWDTVFIEQPYLPQGVDREYLRWLYTAITRARRRLYLIGFTDDFFVGNA
ncbi:MAG: ATP-binding domain-containing protein, partial [Bacteroidota bacterium]